jgi:hypothetical protein
LTLADQTLLKKIIGYTIGNDMSSRDIEGGVPLPQAKSMIRPPPVPASRWSDERLPATLSRRSASPSAAAARDAQRRQRRWVFFA